MQLSGLFSRFNAYMERIWLKRNPSKMEGVVVYPENLFEGYNTVLCSWGKYKMSFTRKLRKSVIGKKSMI